MEASSPAKLYATLVGGALTIGGIIGFFYSASFGSPGSVDDAFGVLAVNGWHNVVHLATGLLGLAAAGYLAREYVNKNRKPSLQEEEKVIEEIQNQGESEEEEEEAITEEGESS